MDIHQGRGDARILGATLQRIVATLAEIAAINGGSACNAIPRGSGGGRRTPTLRGGRAGASLLWLRDGMEGRLGGFDPELQITAEKASRSESVLDKADAKHIIEVLVTAPHGVMAMSPDVPGLVQNSTNLAIVSVHGDVAEIITSQRSAIEASKHAVAQMVATVFRMAGFDVVHAGSYPGWKPEPTSEIVQKLQRVHEQLFGNPAKLIAMHAGLECGVIGEKYPGMQMVSFGPTIVDPHSPNEREDFTVHSSGVPGCAGKI